MPVFDNSTVVEMVYKFEPDLNQCTFKRNDTFEITQREIPVFLDLPKVILKNENYNLPNISDDGILGS